MNWNTLKKLGTAHAKGHRNGLRKHDWAEQRHEAAIAEFLHSGKNCEFLVAKINAWLDRWPQCDPNEYVPYLANGDTLQHVLWCWARYLTRGF